MPGLGRPFATEVVDQIRFDLRSYLNESEKNLTKRVSQGCRDLKSDGNTLWRQVGIFPWILVAPTETLRFR